MKMALRSAAEGMGRLASPTRGITVLRLLFPIALIEIALWSPLPAGILIGVAAFWYIAWQVQKAQCNALALGFDLRGLLRQSWLVGAVVLLASCMLFVAYFSGTLHRLFGLRNPWFAVAAYFVWALVQEFMLQCFCVPMLRSLVSRVSALLLAGAVFAVAHLPNPNLTLVTFFAGVAFTALYARMKNLYAIALIHAVLGLTLAVATPDNWFNHLHVGRTFVDHPPAAQMLPTGNNAPNR